MSEELCENVGRNGWEGGNDGRKTKKHEGSLVDSLETHAQAVVSELPGIHKVELDVHGENLI